MRVDFEPGFDCFISLSFVINTSYAEGAIQTASPLAAFFRYRFLDPGHLCNQSRRHFSDELV
jgi:hypothetical protein